jgi:RHS repeat-associated protein
LFETCANFPFGDQLACTGAFDPSPDHFTGKERDVESGLDNFGLRYYGSALGRFLSPDPSEAAGFAYMDDPQAWNGYAYARNSPSVVTDPDGDTYHVCDQWGKNCSDVSDAQFDRMKQDANRAGEIWKDGRMYLRDGTFAGTYEQTDVDLNPTAQALVRQPIWSLASRVTDHYIAGPLVTFLSFAVPGALEAPGPAAEFFGWISEIEGHHSIPMFLGGNAKQALTALSRGAHRAFHAALRKELKKLGFPLNVGGRGGGAAAWAKYLATNPEARAAALEAVRRASAMIDSQYGTHLAEDFMRNVAAGSFK